MDKKIILPALFALLTVALIAGYALVLMLLPLPAIIKAIIGAAVIASAVAMAVVTFQRNRELKEEEKNDISKY